MLVLVLSPYPERIAEALAGGGDEVRATEQPIRETDADFLVSYGYRHILLPPLIGAVPAINLHISFLPWNRGADPNLWSWIDGTPKGVTIHEIDEGIDTGPILVQREVWFGDDETLATSYARLRSEMETLFAEVWPAIRAGTAPRTLQTGPSSYHRSRDRAAVEHVLTRGWDTPVRELRKLRRPQRP